MLQLTLLGPFQAIRNGMPLTRFGSVRTRALLAYLVLEAGRPHRRDMLAGLFWPDQPEPVALHNLKQTLLQLRTTVGDRDSDRPLIVITRQTLEINPAADYWLDVAAFTTALDTCQIHSHNELERCAACIERMQQAVDLYRGPLLDNVALTGSDAFDEWLLLARAALQRRAAEALGHLARAHTAGRHVELAEQYARRWIAIDPLREEAQRQLILTLALAGQPELALAAYDSYCTLLAERLQIAPAPETAALAEQIRQHKQLPAPLVASVSVHREDWDTAPAGEVCYGREDELALLSSWLIEDTCRLIAVVGMGGIGKTTLVARLARSLASQFEVVIWRSLLNTPSLEALLSDYLQVLTDDQLAALPTTLTLDGQLRAILGLLGARRCLLILDNVESLFQPGGQAGQYLAGYEPYGWLLRQVGEGVHQSCIIITSREQPYELLRLERPSGPVRRLTLTGLDSQASQELLQRRGCAAQLADVAILSARYGGSPLALQLMVDTIVEQFGGNVAAFLRHEAPVVDDVRSILDQLFARLSPIEHAIMVGLALAREPLPVPRLAAHLQPRIVPSQLLEALGSLRRRSLLEREPSGFTLQHVVLEAMVARIIDLACTEIASARLDLLARHALLRTDGVEHIRQNQVRMVIQPIARWLAARLGDDQLASQIHGLLETMRGTAQANSYAAGNLLNLAISLGYDLHNFDLSHLSVWQADLRGQIAPGLSLAYADLAGTVFTDSFGFVAALAFSPDGRLLAASSGDYTIRLWNASDGTLASTLLGHQHYVWGLAWSPDGTVLASASWDQTVVLWDVGTGVPLHTLQGHTSSVRTVAFSPDGAALASGGNDPAILIWDAPTARLRFTLGVEGEQVWALSFSPDGTLLASSGTGGLVYLWQSHDGRLRHRLAGHTGRVIALAWSPDGQTLASAGEDQHIRLWDVASATLGQTLEGHSDWIWALSFSPDGALLASSGADLLVRLWDVRSGEQRRRLQGHSDWVRGLAFRPDGALLASGGDDASVRLWDLPAGLLHMTLRGHARRVWALSFSPDGHTLISGGDDLRIWLWDVQARKVRSSMPSNTQLIYCLSFSPDGQTLASAAKERSVRLRNVADGRPIACFHSPGQGINWVCFSPDGRLLAGADNDGTVQLWDGRSGELVKTLAGHSDRLWSVAFSPDGRMLVSSGEDCEVRVWSVTHGEIHQICQGHTRCVNSVCFSPDSTLVASASDDHSVGLWDVPTGQRRHELHGHDGWVWAVSFSPDGKTLASASADASIRIWDVHQGQVRHILRGHLGWVVSLAFSPDGETLASGSADETIRLWDVRAGRCLAVLHVPGPYEGMNITGVTSITSAQRAALKALGASDGAPAGTLV